MWENEHKKIIIRNVVVFLLLIVVVGVLLVMMKNVNAQIEEEDALLRQEHSSQRQELNEAREENLAAVQQTYEQHQEVVAQYLPGIVCWGDSLTAGSSGNVSYPLTLQKYINTYLCDIYDIRYSVENPESYPRLNWENYKISIPVVNMGAGQENTTTVLGRSGVLPFVVKSDFVIPAGKESVYISIMSEDGKSVSPLTAGDTGMNPVTIAGVQGTLTRIANPQVWNPTPYQFTRLEEGQEVSVTKGTQIVTASSEAYKDYIHIVWIGTYGEFINPETLVNETRALLQRQIGNSDRYLVIGPCTYNGTWESTLPISADTIDSAMIQAFGDHYINFRKYLMVDGLRDAKLNASSDDTKAIKNGRVPVSFRSQAGGADLNSVAYTLLGEIIYERMELLGYFNEVRDALRLDKITQDILKSNPDYFETHLK